jgi:carboxymethylenebutenolidase
MTRPVIGANSSDWSKERKRSVADAAREGHPVALRLRRAERRAKTAGAMTISDHEFVDLPTPSGPMRTFLFRPVAEGKYPGILLFSEIFQVTGPIRRTAALLAGNGFVVAVPEIYHEYEPPGTALSYDSAGADRGNELKTTKPLEAYDADARAVLEFLKLHPSTTGKLGVVGICIGGHLAFRAAMNADVLAGTCFYATDIHKRGLGHGTNDDTLDRMSEIRGEMLMIWGRQDPHVPNEGRRKIYDAMTDAGVLFQWHEFNAAHAFIRDEGPRYDPSAAQICYAMALELFKRRLGEGDLPKATAASGETRH